MLKHLFKIHALSWIQNKALTNEALSQRMHLYIVREAELTQLDLLVGLFDLSWLEWWPSAEHRVEDDTDRPVVDLVAVAIAVFEHFRSQVVWCAADSLLALAFKHDLGGKAEIPNFELHTLS